VGKKKVLRIRANEFLYQLHSDRMDTTGHVKYAMDISELNWETIYNVMENLRKQGYVQAEIIEVN
jgi:hypothetical protein